MLYILLRVEADGKKAETWTAYGPPGLETKQSVSIKGFKSETMLFTSWGNSTYTVPISSSVDRLLLSIKLIDNKQVQYATGGGVTGNADCEKSR